LVHEFGWAWDDWDRLAAGTMVGHLVECTGQATGGNLSWSWWEHVDDEGPYTFPVAEVDRTAAATIGKVPGSGGRVCIETVREQLLYEIHDPGAYVAPDVVADLSEVGLTEVGHDRVRMTGVRGHPSPPTYKALVCTPAGWTGDISIGLGWPDAVAKARALAAIIVRRTAAAGVLVQEWVTEIWGHDALLPGAATTADPSEVVLRLAWRCADRDSACQVGRIVPPLYTSGPVPGITTATRAFRFDASELFDTVSLFVDRATVDQRVRVRVSE
jgi:hypothetical protein